MEEEFVEVLDLGFELKVEEEAMQGFQAELLILEQLSEVDLSLVEKTNCFVDCRFYLTKYS
jgi:hypothetical protein